MQEQEFQGFTKFLKKTGKKPHVIADLIRQAERFESFLSEGGKDLTLADHEDVRSYIERMESDKPGSARVSVRGVALYYAYSGQPELAAVFSQVRQAEIVKTRKGFLLSRLIGVEAEHITRLRLAGILTNEQMLSAGSTPALRQALAEQIDVPVGKILELVKLSDLTRLGGVKAVRARLYHDAGADTVEKIAGFMPEELLHLTAEFVERTGFDGIAPLPKEVRSTIEEAKKLPKFLFL